MSRRFPVTLAYSVEAALNMAVKFVCRSGRARGLINVDCLYTSEAEFEKGRKSGK